MVVVSHFFSQKKKKPVPGNSAFSCPFWDVENVTRTQRLLVTTSDYTSRYNRPLHLLHPNWPPEKEAPQVTVEPSWRIAAKAYQVACRVKKENFKTQHFNSYKSAPKLFLNHTSTTTSHTFKLHGECKTARWFNLTFSYPSWRSLNLWRGHLTIPKRAQRIARSCYFHLDFAWISLTSWSWLCTVELSPPAAGSPQVTTCPSAKIAANALKDPWIFSTPPDLAKGHQKICPKKNGDVSCWDLI